MFSIYADDSRKYEQLYDSLEKGNTSVADLEAEEVLGLAKHVIIYDPSSSYLWDLRERMTSLQKQAIQTFEQGFQTPLKRKVEFMESQSSYSARQKLFLEPDDPIRQELFPEEPLEPETSSLKLVLMLTGAAAIYGVVIHPFLKKRVQEFFRDVGEKSSPPL